MTATVRPATTTCCTCGLPIHVGTRGALPTMHPDCRRLGIELRRVQAAAERLLEAMGDNTEAKRILRKSLCGEFFSWSNATFNPSKRTNATKAKRTRAKRDLAGATRLGLLAEGVAQ